MRMLVPLLIALFLAGCGGDSESTPNAGGGGSNATPEATGGGGEQIALASPEDGALEFDKTELTAKAGEITIDYDNPSSTPHAVEIEGEDATSDTVTAGKTSVSADLAAGTYTFFCPVGNHREEGMEGTLTVQ